MDANGACMRVNQDLRWDVPANICVTVQERFKSVVQEDPSGWLMVDLDFGWAVGTDRVAAHQLPELSELSLQYVSTDQMGHPVMS